MEGVILPWIKRSDDRPMWPDPAETRRLLDHLAASAENDPVAEGRLWACHRDPLRRMIGLRLDRAVGRRVDASDVVQEVLLKASSRLAQYLRNPAIPFDLWLRQIARDHVIDAHRKHRASQVRSVDRERSTTGRSFGDQSSLDLANQLRDPELTPAAASLRRELEVRFRDAIDGLNHDDREIILLRHFERMSNGEAARTLNLSEPACGMRHLRALRKLRAVLGESPSGSNQP